MITLNDISINYLFVDSIIITVDATTNINPLEYSLDGFNWQDFNYFHIEDVYNRNTPTDYNIHLRDGGGDRITEKVYLPLDKNIEVNQYNFVRWKKYQGVYLDQDGNFSCCPGPICGNNTPIDLIKDCPVCDI